MHDSKAINRRDNVLDQYCRNLNSIFEREKAEAGLHAMKVTAERNAQIAQEAMIEAQSANRSKTEFLAAMSHELRTPLNAVLGFSDLLKSSLEAKGDSELGEYAHDIYESGDHLLEIINDILDIVRIEGGTFEIDETQVPVSDITDSCVNMITGRAEEAGVALKQDIPLGLPDIYGDPRRLKQAIMNLLSNAVKFTEKGGTITLSVRADSENNLAIEVSDTGIGMAPEEIPKIMRPFAQADGALSRKYEGTGLGLPIAKAIVEKHGADLIVSSIPGKGTMVTIVMPPSRVRSKGGAEASDIETSEEG